MLYDQENQLKASEKQLEMEEAFNQLVKENQTLQNKQMYYEDLLEKK